ncbi:MAG: hypothetical protein IIC25_01305 [Chloroflexi bacterium]|nr:hypothetical protein [Chloroflexota bacterium]
MAWLTSLLNRPATIDDERKASAQDTPGAAQPPPAASGPPLAILAPDIGGISSFRLRFFSDAATAATDVEQLPPEIRRGTHAFWALHDEPVVGPDGHREALVLIRANQTSGVFYAVSFVDMENAWSFARFEAKRGLDVSHLIILWAAFVTVREELDGVSLLPAAAPATRTQHDRTAERDAAALEATEAVRELERPEEPTISASTAAPEAPEKPKPAEAEAEEATRIAKQAQDELRDARAAADAARALAEAEKARRQEAERRLEEQQQAADDAARARALADLDSGSENALAVSEAAAEEPVVLDGGESRTQVLEDPSPAIEAPAEIRSYAGDEETLADDALDDGEEPTAQGTIFAHAPPTETEEDTETVEVPEYLRRPDDAGDAGNDLPDAPKLDDFDIAYEVARLLETRRWEKREEPFHGFGSPPGKF